MFDWKNPLFRFGVKATAVWLIVGVGLMAFGGNWSQGVKPNEWGDIFAGLFAPVAFLWLVLGFVQQGHELQLSTKALMLQVEELKNTVAHQRDLVEVTREQVAAAIRQEKQVAAAALPRFMLSQSGSSKTGSRISYSLHLRNVGAAAARIVVLADKRTVTEIPSLSTDEQKSFTFAFDPTPTAPVMWKVQFIDANGLDGEVVFIGTPTGNSMKIDPGRGVFA